jgi:hypothetical protein
MLEGLRPSLKILPLPQGKGIKGMGLPIKGVKNMESAVKELEEREGS